MSWIVCIFENSSLACYSKVTRKQGVNLYSKASTSANGTQAFSLNCFPIRNRHGLICIDLSIFLPEDRGMTLNNLYASNHAHFSSKFYFKAILVYIIQICNFSYSCEDKVILNYSLRYVQVCLYLHMYEQVQVINYRLIFLYCNICNNFVL